MTSKPITDELINELHKQLWDEATKEYGSKYKVPPDVMYEIGEKYRALMVIQYDRKNGDSAKNPFIALGYYSIQPQIAEWVVREYCGIQEVKEAKKALVVEKRADKWDSFLKWANQHHFEQFTTEQLMEQCGFSYQTTLKYIQVSPTFRKLKRGLWEIRDAKFDKKAGI